jgi:bacillithiol system protein YtxJ
LLANRDISNAIAHEMQVQHQSPQLLCIHNGKCVFHANHGNIDPVEVKPYL